MPAGYWRQEGGQIWLQHWVLPLYKEKAKWLAKSWRGVHLTAQLARASERFLQRAFATFFYSSLVSGEHQFAYKPGRGARDALALLVLTWVAGFDKGYKYAVYCSDVSGAFDRVRAGRLLKKLQAAGVPLKWLKVFQSWLRQRAARVAVGGELSDAMVLMDMVVPRHSLGTSILERFFWRLEASSTEEGLY